jgi:hypothetical protein
MSSKANPWAIPNTAEQLTTSGKPSGFQVFYLPNVFIAKNISPWLSRQPHIKY